MSLPEFREAIAASLVIFNDKRPAGRPTSRPSTPVESPVPALRRGMKAVHPQEEIRTTGQHFGIWLENS